MKFYTCFNCGLTKLLFENEAHYCSILDEDVMLTPVIIVYINQSGTESIASIEEEKE